MFGFLILPLVVIHFLSHSLKKKEKGKSKHKGFSFCWVCLGWSLLSLCQPKGRRKRKDVCGYGICLPSHHYGCWVPCFQGMPAHLPADEKQWMNSFVWLHVQFLISLLTVIILVHETFHLPSIFSPSCGRGNVEAVAWAFGCWLGSVDQPALLQFWKLANLTSLGIVKNYFLIKCLILQIRPVPVWISSTFNLKWLSFAPLKWST